jgi:all-trans-retinol 13,14-reductase
MAKDWLAGVGPHYDVIIIGSGLGGLTSANILAKQGRKVLLLEHHYQFGGLATWFKRPGGHIFDISLHGFPYGMVKSCRKYWTRAIADSIVQLKGVRFVNPQFDVRTTFDRADFTRILTRDFELPEARVHEFYAHLAEMNFYDNDQRTTGELFEEFFPGRPDVHRLLLEPIAYANGSSLDDPAITFGIVFSNFMSRGVFTFQGGTDQLIQAMLAELRHNGVEVRKCALGEKILVERTPGADRPKVAGVLARSQNTGGEQALHHIRCEALISNANLKNTIFKLTGEEHFQEEFLAEARRVRMNWSSCQVYMGLRVGESIPHIGDLIFTSESPRLDMRELTDLRTTSKTFSIYYPETRPHLREARYAIVASLNARYEDWNQLDEKAYAREKERLCEEAVNSLEKHLPGIRPKIEHIEAATPRTVEGYTRHHGGASFGTKFEGLRISMGLPEQITGLYHAGSVGIIMSGWLGTINYGVITASKLERTLDLPTKA